MRSTFSRVVIPVPELAEQQLAAFRQDGFVQLPGVVPPELVAAALGAINRSLGAKGVDPEDLPIFRMDTFCPELQAAPEILALLHETPLWRLAESAIGAGKLAPVTFGQIALRFPSDDETSFAAHIDGLYTAPFRAVSGRAPMRPVPVESLDERNLKIRNFTALVGVYLSEVAEEDAGNLAVWPGSHHRLEDFYRQHGRKAILVGMPKIDIGKPRQLLAQPGDAVFCHYQLGHGIAPNLSPHVRYAIYFRLYRTGHEEITWECMTDIWREWDGIAP
jgi:hypothetical protein